MIKSFKHKGLKLFFETGSKASIDASQSEKLAYRLSVLEDAMIIDDIDIQGFYLHKLTGEKGKLYSIRVTGNWRITFEFIEGDVYIVNYEDYH